MSMGKDTEVFGSGAARSKLEGSPRYDLIPANGLRRLAIRFSVGAERYGAWNWTKDMPAEVVINHMQEHLNRVMRGEPGDDDLAAIAWAAFNLMYYQEFNPKVFAGLLHHNPTKARAVAGRSPRRRKK